MGTEIEKTEKKLPLVIGNKGTLADLLEDKQDAIKGFVKKHITAERLTKSFMLAVSRNPKLYKCTTASLFQCFMKGAETQLDFGISGKAHLVPFKNGYLSKKQGTDVYEAVFMPGYQGYIDVMYRNPAVTIIDAQIVFSNDTCKIDLGRGIVEHVPSFDEDRGMVLGVYGRIQFRRGDSTTEKVEWMSKADIEKVRQCSKAKDDDPWKYHWNEMARKTVIRRIRKYVPDQNETLDVLDEADNTAFGLQAPMDDDETLTGVEGIKNSLKSKPVDSTVKEPEPQDEAPAETPPIEDDSDEPMPLRFYCQGCDNEFPTAKNKAGKPQCPKCLGFDVLDRQAAK